MEVPDRTTTILGPGYHWVDMTDRCGRVVALRFNYGTVAVIRPDDRGCAITITYGKRTLLKRGKSVRQTCRYIERWIQMQDTNGSQRPTSTERRRRLGLPVG